MHLRSLLTFCIFLFLVSSSLAQWQMADAPLKTNWSAAVNPYNVWREYPRPNMLRSEWKNLNGLWDLWILDRNTDQNYHTGQILVPFPVESALSGVGKKVEPHHIMNYRRRFEIPQAWNGKRVLLHFGAVDYESEVFVNGVQVGWHHGGYDPFSFDITDRLVAGGEQELTVVVTDSTNAGGQAVGKQSLDPHGIWYSGVSGTWQTVWLEAVPQSYISEYRCEPDLDKSRVIIRAQVQGERRRDLKLIARVNGENFNAESAGRPGTPLLLRISNPRAWSPDDPFLYDLELELVDDAGNSIDKVKGYFGLRKISVEKDAAGVPRLYLNNEPLFQLGLLDQGYWPDGLYTAPTEEALIHDIATAKNMGFNLLRKHVKVEPQRWYYHCDRLGMLVWQDMPSAANNSVTSRKKFRVEMKAMVDALFNHPSVVMWVPFNEGWGQFNTDRFVVELKNWDPTRLVDNASGWTDSGFGDVIDIHSYPEPKAPSAEEAGPDRARVLGEFGGLGLNIKGHTWTGKGWGYELIQSSEGLMKAYEDLIWQLLPLNREAGLSAAVYTQLSDIEEENNGLVTYDRLLVKIDPMIVKKINAGYLTPRPDRLGSFFYKKAPVTFRTLKEGATIRYKLGEGEWKVYEGPLSLRKTTTLAVQAEWPDGSKSLVGTYEFRKMKALKSKAPKDLSQGLEVKMYRGIWDQLPDFAQLSPDTVFTLSEVELPAGLPKEKCGLLFSGWLEVPETGAYVFQLNSDDGSSLSIAGQAVVENDGIHGMRKKQGELVLKKGKHPFSLKYFQKFGGQGLELKILDAKGNPKPVSFWH
ncbi:MAG: hypothetical protein CMN32_01795 [Saprospirales bacterium]|nr:hypothetical protein [Saprospirales bacterium]